MFACGKMKIENAQNIIKNNIKILYRLPYKYKNLNRLFTMYPTVKDILLKTLNYIKDKELIIYKHKYCFTLSTNALTKIRRKTTTSVSNRYINFIACIGLINKQYQSEDDCNLTWINYEHIKRMKELELKELPINTFYIRPYTEKELYRLDARAEQILVNNITPGNISADKLKANNCSDLAEEVYFNNGLSINTRNNELTVLVHGINDLINSHGYTTKEQIYKDIKIDRKVYTNYYSNVLAINRLLKIYKGVLYEDFIYKRPTKEQKNKYKLKSDEWIYLRKDNYEEKQ